MKTTLFALIGVIMYAIQNTIIDVRLKQYSTVSLLIGWYGVLLPLAVGLFVYQKIIGSPVVIPTGSNLWMLVAVAVMFFVADFFYIGAYTAGGDAVTITILLAMMPVVAALMKFVWVKEIPTFYHVVGFICALFAVGFVAVGNAKRPIEIPAVNSSVANTPR
jgi:drug/metabolite transporter (DMT)-like permease